MIYSTVWLLKQISEKRKVDYLFFWDHRPWPPDTADERCLSQWSPQSFTVACQLYSTAEHWMMAEKARLFADEETLTRILAAPTPADAKKLGQRVQGFVQKTWDAHKSEIVKAGNLHKFSQHPESADFLLSTGSQVLVEASPMDVIWGIGLAAHAPAAGNPTSWRGQNLLGFALMEVRDELNRRSNNTVSQLESTN